MSMYSTGKNDNVRGTASNGGGARQEQTAEDAGRQTRQAETGAERRNALQAGPLTPNSVMQLQRAVGNQAVGRLLAESAKLGLMLKPDMAAGHSSPPGSVMQRKIVGLSGENIWAEQIAGEVSAEKDEKIRDAVHRLHSISFPVPTSGYEDLVKRLERGSFDALLEKSLGESPDDSKYEESSDPALNAMAGLISGMTDDYSGSLSSHPQTAALISAKDNKPEWNIKGINEVLGMFLYLYANADIVQSYFTKHKDQLNEGNLKLLDIYFNSKLGALVLESYLEGLKSGSKSFAALFKEGLDAMEQKLAEYKDDKGALNSYITSNLDNDTKAYSRKLGLAKESPRSEKSLEIEFISAIGKTVSTKTDLVVLVYYKLAERNGGTPTVEQVIETIRSLGGLLGELEPTDEEIQTLYNEAI